MRELFQQLRTTPPDLQARVNWTPVESALPESGRAVLLTIENARGKRQVIRAQHAAKRTLEQSPDCDGGEYDEKTDTYWCEEGWYEWNDSEEIHWRVSDKAIAWAPLPDPYREHGGDAPTKDVPPDLQKRVEELERALNPRQWDTAMNDAWHRNIPDMFKAFAALRDAAQESGK